MDQLPNVTNARFSRNKLYALTSMSFVLCLGLVATIEGANAQFGSTGTNSTQTTNATQAQANSTQLTTSNNSTSTANNTNTSGTAVSNNTGTTTAQAASKPLIGQISSVQLDNSSKPAWIQSGVWVMRGNVNSSTPQVNQFYARFEMIKPDGTAMHKHMVYKFQQSNGSMQGTTISINGTATVTMPQGPVTGVPVSIKIFNQKLIGIWIGPDKVNGHFATSPVYGTISNPAKGIMSEMNSAGTTTSSVNSTAFSNSTQTATTPTTNATSASNSTSSNSTSSGISNTTSGTG